MKAVHTMLIAAAVATATLASPMAHAHAVLKASTPSAGATLDAAPNEITLTFNEKVEQVFSSIAIVDGQGKDVTPGKAKVDAANPAMLRLPLSPLAAGTYTVTWAVAGPDGHRRKGDFKFTVK